MSTGDLVTTERDAHALSIHTILRDQNEEDDRDSGGQPHCIQRS